MSEKLDVLAKNVAIRSGNYEASNCLLGVIKIALR